MYLLLSMGHSPSEVGTPTLGSGGGRAASMAQIAFVIFASHFFFFVCGSAPIESISSSPTLSTCCVGVNWGKMQCWGNRSNEPDV
jgi:hypothetical protein